MKNLYFWRKATEKDINSFIAKTKYGVPPSRAEKEVIADYKLRDMESKINRFINKWNGGAEITKPLTASEAKHLLIQFHIQKPLG